MLKEYRLEKALTGIHGLDEITEGGLPKGRPTLICGNTGCGKTLMAMEFLVHGATQFNEPGVFLAFEETVDDLITNVASLGFDLESLKSEKKVRIDHVQVQRSDFEASGEYDLEALFIRLGHAIDSIGAKRVVLDTLEALFSGISNQAILRSELRRLFQWLKERGVTAVITAERGEDTLTRQGLEEFVSDCVILLDHKVTNQISTRRLRIIKYRGSNHGTNEFPFLIDEDGISVLPITSLQLNHKASNERISTGISSLDKMLNDKGFYKGSTILISGSPGTGKSSFAASFANETCQRKGRCLYLAFEESSGQIIRNMHSIGLDLEQHHEKGCLKFHTVRPTLYGLEMHLVKIHKLVEEFKPEVVIIDPLSNLINVGEPNEVRSMLTRLIDYFKKSGVTALFTALLSHSKLNEGMEEGVFSLVDTWIHIQAIENNGERNRTLYILKSRGMSHSNQVREFIISDKGLDLIDVYVSDGNVEVGSSRVQHELDKKNKEAAQQRETERKQRELETRRKAMEAAIDKLQSEYEADKEELERFVKETKSAKDKTKKDREKITQYRS